MDDLSSDDRLASIERRLAAIERAVGLAVTPSAPHSPVPVTVEMLDERGAVVERTVQAPPVKPPPLPVRAVAAATASPPPAAADRAALPRPAPRVPAARPGLEQTIGLKWAGWVGAVVLTVGAALGVKFAYDQGWFTLVSPAVRLAMMSLASAALLAAGEVVYRRVNRTSAASLFGAGVALAFLVAYAGHGYYDLYGRDAAFALMGVVTLLGAAVAVRGGMVAIAVLALIGGNLAPLILRSDHPRLAPFLAYLLMLQVVALILSDWGRATAWRVLRVISLTTTSLWVGGLLFWRPAGAAADVYGATFAFLVVSAALFHAEAVVGAWRATSRGRHDHDAPPHAGDAAAAATAGYAVAVTALFAAGLLAHLSAATPSVRTAWLLAIAAAAGGAAYAIGRLREDRPRDGDALGPMQSGYLLQAAGLVVAAAPVALSGVWVTVAWGAMAVTFAAASAVLDLRGGRRATVIVWALAAVQLLLWAAGLRIGAAGGVRPGDPWVALLGTTIPAWAVVAATLALLGHVIAGLVALVRERADDASRERPPADGAGTTGGAAGSPPGAVVLSYGRDRTAAARLAAAPSGEPRALAGVADVAAAILWTLAAFAALPPLGATTAVAAYAVALLAVGRLIALPRLTAIGTVALFAAAGKWLSLDTAVARFARTWSPLDRQTLLNGQAALGLFLAAALALCRGLLPRGGGGGVRAAFAAAAAVCVVWAGTVEIDRGFERAASLGTAALRDPLRAKQVAISVYWALAAAAAVVAGFTVRSAAVRVAGLALLAVTLLKVVLVDLAQVQTGYRVLSFLALGLLLLATSVLYGRLAPRPAAGTR